MRCPNCGGMMHHTATDITGKTFYKCQTQLTTLDDPRKAVEGESKHKIYFKSCGLITDYAGRLANENIWYTADGKPKSFRVSDGVELV